MLHRLGVNMGPPYWEESDDETELNFYEPYDLSWHLRNWFEEPRGIERVPAASRIRFLKCWVELQESVGPGPVGAKHPLLSLCGPDLVAAWGSGIRLIWSWRPFDESVAGLERRHWFKGGEASLQQKLWEALHEFERSHPEVVRIDWRHVKLDPARAACELASLAGIEPSPAQLQSAAGFVRQAVPSKSPWWRITG
ncbi:MAG TPA: hypothetical protein VMG10_08440 [Gemmataceae bacterium]|nr:hypothetical protein [Gemmataceae bacterium]